MRTSYVTWNLRILNNSWLFFFFNIDLQHIRPFRNIDYIWPKWCTTSRLPANPREYILAARNIYKKNVVDGLFSAKRRDNIVYKWRAFRASELRVKGYVYSTAGDKEKKIKISLKNRNPNKPSREHNNLVWLGTETHNPPVGGAWDVLKKLLINLNYRVGDLTVIYKFTVGKC